MKRILWMNMAASILFLLLSFMSSGQLLAAPYYEGKRITIVVGSLPGGGYDRMARLIAKHLPKHIPGKPTIIVENVPGAASMITANRIYNIAKPDGLTIGAFQRGIPLAQLMKAEGVKFDVMKYAWIGSPAVEATVLTLRTDLPYKSVDDILKAKAPIMLGSSGPTESSTQFALLLKEFLGLKLEMVVYITGNEASLAIEKREVDGRAGSFSSLKALIDRGVVRPLIRGKASEPEIENLPVDEDLTPDRKGKIIMAMRSTLEVIGRPFVAPPGTPTPIMTILRDGFAKVTKDPEFLGEAKKFGISIDYISAEETLKKLDFFFNQPEDIVKEFGRYVKF